MESLGWPLSPWKDDLKNNLAARIPKIWNSHRKFIKYDDASYEKCCFSVCVLASLLRNCSFSVMMGAPPLWRVILKRFTPTRVLLFIITYFEDFSVIQLLFYGFQKSN